MRRHIPNALTIGRLGLTAGFVAAMSLGGSDIRWPLILFIVASITDALDGYLARLWAVESGFGRIMDPVADKVLVLGALVLFASGPWVERTGVAPWMVIVMLGRELIVTGIRGEMESRGVKFGAMVWGKIKTIVQTIVIPLMMLLILLDAAQPANDVLAWLLVVVTVLSGVPYVRAAMRRVP